MLSLNSAQFPGYENASYSISIFFPFFLKECIFYSWKEKVYSRHSCGSFVLRTPQFVQKCLMPSIPDFSWCHHKHVWLGVKRQTQANI